MRHLWGWAWLDLTSVSWWSGGEPVPSVTALGRGFLLALPLAFDVPADTLELSLPLCAHGLGVPAQDPAPGPAWLYTSLCTPFGFFFFFLLAGRRSFGVRQGLSL